MKSKKIYYNLILFSAALIAFVLFAPNVRAQKASKVDYKGEVVVDSDLDGLTDKGEEQIYRTNPALPDTDGDGFYDGAEVLNGTDPLDPNSPRTSESVALAQEKMGGDIPWAWYAARAAGLIGFVFLWITVFLGLSIRNPVLRKFIQPVYSFDFHCFTAATAVFWALVHGTSLLFDAKINFGLKDIAIPFFSKTTFVDTNHLALGIMAFYMMVIILITSYLRSHLNHKLWRGLHFLNPVVFIFVVWHGYFNGTDMKNFYVGSAFLFSSFILVVLYLTSLISTFIQKIKQARVNNLNAANYYDNQNQN